MNRIKPSEDSEQRKKGRARAVSRWLESLPSLTDEDKTILRGYLDKYPHIEVCRAFVVRDYKKGVGRQLIIDRYGLTTHEYRKIGIQAGFFRPKTF